MKKNSILLICCFLLSSLIIQSCKKDKKEAEKTDKSLYSDATSSGYSYYQSANLLSAAAPSPHGSFKLRFNSIAQSALDMTGELRAGGTFPTGSIIVKEVYSAGSVSLYAVLKKDPSNIYAKNGWLWAEYKTNGDASFSVYNKGDGCVSCHTGSPNRDLVRTFDLH